MTIEVTAATTTTQLDAVRALMRAFIAWHRERHADKLALVERYFDAAAFAAELASLPGPYAPPAGRLLLATLDGRSAGCVALKPIEGMAGGCEMKRMFVPPGLQGRGVGRALATRLLDEARAASYTTMRLDTGIRQREAQALYRSLGFVDTVAPPDTPLPPELREWLVFMALELRAGA